jgi:hypothetical protein
MRPARLAVVLVLATLSFCLACGGGGQGGGNHGGGSPTSPGGTTSATFMDEGTHFAGVQPAPLVIGGITYVYQNSGSAGTQVEAAPDGRTFAPTPASYPAGVSRTIVATQDGHYRMYYLADGASVNVSSAVSSDGLTWTVEDGIRYGDPAIGSIRATALPTGGYRLYYPTASGGITSAFSGDGLTFSSEGPVTITVDATAPWGPATAAYVNGQFHMVLTRAPSTGVSELWHAVSSDGRTWTIDPSVLAVNPSVPLNQPAWGINGGTLRVYYRAQPPGGASVIGSALIAF